MESPDNVRCIACWACRTTIQVPKVNGEWAPDFMCGWCGAITNTRPPPSKGKRGLLLPMNEDCCTRCFVNCISKVSQLGAVLFVVCLLLTVMTVGIFGLLPKAFTSYSTLLWSQVLALFISINILINYLMAASLSSRSTSTRLPRIQRGTIPKGVYERYRFCVKCQNVKAPNVHHCSVCNACIEEMDHHCPFIGNCVGKRNLRSFILFLLWTSIGSIYAMTVSAMLMIKSGPFIKQNHTHRSSIWSWMFLMQNSLPWWGLASYYVFAISMGGGIGVTVLLATQFHQILRGQTYIDQLKGQTSNDRTETLLSKFGRVLGGRNPLFWLLPFSTERIAYESLDWKVR